MQDGGWSQALTELVQQGAAAIVRFWKQVVLQVGMALGVFLALALPLLLVILLLWYLDSTGWRPSSGFYKIGLWQDTLGPSPPQRVAELRSHIAAGGPEAS